MRVEQQQVDRERERKLMGSYETEETIMCVYGRKQESIAHSNPSVNILLSFPFLRCLKCGESGVEDSFMTGSGSS